MGVLPRLYKLWPWVDQDLFYTKVIFGHIGFHMRKNENYLIFGNYCSLRSRSCLKHLAEWVNEVEWVSKVKVILWPWSKVTQISKLNIWLLACILRWAIQGLMALLLLFHAIFNADQSKQLLLFHAIFNTDQRGHLLLFHAIFNADQRGHLLLLHCCFTSTVNI